MQERDNFPWRATNKTGLRRQSGGFGDATQQKSNRSDAQYALPCENEDRLRADSATLVLLQQKMSQLERFKALLLNHNSDFLKDYKTKSVAAFCNGAPESRHIITNLDSRGGEVQKNAQLV